MYRQIPSSARTAHEMERERVIITLSSERDLSFLERLEVGDEEEERT